MRILIAGGAGYLGSVLGPRLVELGHEVTVVDLLWFGNHLPSGVRILEKDVLALEDGDVRGADAVVFLAGLSNDPMAEYDPALNFSANVTAPTYLAYLARKNRVKRFVYAGSCAVYGYSHEAACSEDSPTTTTTPYGISKLLGERNVLHFQSPEFSTISLRMGTVCGSSPRMRFDLVLNTMFKTAATEGVVRVGDPAAQRPILSIQDASEAFVVALKAPPGVSGVFNITSTNSSVHDLGLAVQERVSLLLGRPIRIEILDQKETRSYVVTSEKAAAVLGFKPGGGVSQILEDLASHWPSFKDVDSAGYYNIRCLEERLGRGARHP